MKGRFLTQVRRQELGILAIVHLLHMLAFRILLTGQGTLVHDNLVWNYPTFQVFFAELTSGHLPIYNFYSHFGEPFLPNASQMRFLDPIQALLGALIWKLAPGPVLAFNWFHYLIGLIQCWGIYLFLRGYTKSIWVRGVLIVGLLFSSAFVAPLRQDGILNQFLWIPYMAYIVREKYLYHQPSWRAAILLGCLVGSTFQSYFFVMPFIFLFVYVGFSWLCRADVFIFRNFKANWLYVILILAPLVFMSALNIQILSASRSWVFPARTLPVSPEYQYKFDPERIRNANNKSSLMLDKKTTQMTGASARFWDYIQSWSPWGNQYVSKDPKYFYGDPSEAYIYVGLFIMVAGFIGLASVSSAEDFVFLNLLSMFFLLSFGQDAGLTMALSYIFPPLALVRNMHCLSLFVHFAFFYFVVKGCQKLDEKLERLASLRV